MAETKVTSIRASEETTFKFKTLSEQFPNSAECLKALISSYEMNQAKEILTGQETYINDFQSHIDALMRAYISVLDLNANAENRIKDKFRASLEEKDKIISNLQAKLTKSEAAEKKLKAENAEMKAKLEQESMLESLMTEIKELKKSKSPRKKDSAT